MLTNREWLTSLPDEQLVKHLRCTCCTKDGYDEEFNNCFGESCETYMTDWLNREHKDDEFNTTDN